MALYSAVVTRESQRVLNGVEWETTLRKKKSKQDQDRGYMLVRSPPSATPPLKVVGVSPMVADFTELFVYNTSGVTSCKTVLDMFPLWAGFLKRYLNHTYPLLLPPYLALLKEQKLAMGGGIFKEGMNPLEAFVYEVSFQSCVHAMTERAKVYKVGEKFGFCTLVDREEDGFVLVGNILWDRSNSDLKWHLTATDLFDYIPAPRIYVSLEEHSFRHRAMSPLYVPVWERDFFSV